LKPQLNTRLTTLDHAKFQNSFTKSIVQSYLEIAEIELSHDRKYLDKRNLAYL